MEWGPQRLCSASARAARHGRVQAECTASLRHMSERAWPASMRGPSASTSALMATAAARRACQSSQPSAATRPLAGVCDVGDPTMCAMYGARDAASSRTSPASSLLRTAERREQTSSHDRPCFVGWQDDSQLRREDAVTR